MKVFIVEGYVNYEGCDVLGVFADRQDAEAFIVECKQPEMYITGSDGCQQPYSTKWESHFDDYMISEWGVK